MMEHGKNQRNPLEEKKKERGKQKRQCSGNFEMFVWYINRPLFYIRETRHQAVVRSQCQGNLSCPTCQPIRDE
jgi:hypothetical protein